MYENSHKTKVESQAHSLTHSLTHNESYKVTQSSELIAKIVSFLDKVKWFGLRKLYWFIKRRTIWLKDIPASSFIKKSIIGQIIDYYNGDAGHQTDTKTGNLGYGFIHYALIRNLKPQRVLCIGSIKGYIPAICALACKDNQKGKVDFVDVGYDETNSKSWSGIGFWRKADVKKHFSFLGLSDWLDFHLMTSAEFNKNFPERQFSYVYIDGDHSYEGAKNDYQLFWPKLIPGGFMVFHDATVKDWGVLKNFGVWKLLKEISDQKKIILPLDQSGLAIIQK